jgi:hypothetical protein
VAAFAAVAQTRAGAPSPGGDKSTWYRTNEPKIFVWSIVWFAPLPRDSDGRSAVSNNKGALDSHASTHAGSKFATAVPLDVITAHPALPNPAPFPTPNA